MPNPSQILKAKERREARDAARSNHNQQAYREGQELSAKSEEQAVAKATPGYVRDDVRAGPPKSRKEQVAAKHRAAERQADLDAAVVARTPSMDEVQTALNRGGETPLHLLNAMAKEADDNIRSESREIGKAAGAAAFEAAQVLRPDRSRHQRFIRQRRANDLLKTDKAE